VAARLAFEDGGEALDVGVGYLVDAHLSLRL
jgi:hypothetical protein